MEKIIDYIKRAKSEMQMRSKEPTKIMMDTPTFCMMIEELDDYTVIDVKKNGDKRTFYVCGLEIERRDDMAEDTKFIVS